MKHGDLVKMRDEMWWRLPSRSDYSAENALVIEVFENTVKVLYPDGEIKKRLTEYFEIVLEV